MADPSSNQSIHTLFGEALRESADLARKEIALFKAEMTENVRALVMGLAMMIAAAVFAIVAISLFTKALVDWLATVVHSEALSAFIVGVVMAAVAVGLVLYGKSRMSPATLAPSRTVRNVRRDAEVLTERVSG
jgi:hypothetical protein